jgi:hypothetical protein
MSRKVVSYIKAERDTGGAKVAYFTDGKICVPRSFLIKARGGE